MKVQINNIQYSEAIVTEMQSNNPIGSVQFGETFANCTVYLDNGDRLEYKVNLFHDEDFHNLIYKIKNKVIEYVGRIDA